MPTIPFGAWTPDQPTLDNTALIARNVIPADRSYRPFPQLAAFSTSLSARAIGAISVRNAAGTVYNYVGESANIRQLVGNSWSAVTSLSGSYTTADSDFWEFVQWGQTVIGCNGHTDQMQTITLGAANFSGLAGSPPKAKHLTVVRDFVVAGNVSDSALSITRVRWPAFNNPTSWTVDTATLADYQDLPTEAGEIRRLVGGQEYGLVFQERAITRITFVGSPYIFRFDQVQAQLGLYAPQALCQYQNLVFFLAEDGFYSFDGAQLQPIGRGRVDRYFLSTLDTLYVGRIVAVADPINRIAVWAYPATGSSGMLTRLLLYSWAYDRWAEVTGISLDYVWRALTTGVTLDGLDAYFSSLDEVTPDLDDRYWQGGNVVLAGVSNRRLQYFNGAAMSATLDTGEFAPFRARNGIGYVTQARPLVEASATVPLRLSISQRNRLDTAATWTTPVAPVSSGECMVRATGRYLRARLELSASATWTHTVGVEIDATFQGVR